MHVGTYTNNFFLNGAFDQPFVPVNGGSPAVTGVVAHNWFDNSLWASVNVAYQGDSVAPHGGGAAQKITVRSLTNGEAQLVQHVSVVAGKSYTFGAWLRGQPGVNANLKIINLNPPYTVYATTPALSLTGAWQYFSATGQVNDTGDALLVVGGASNGTFSIDDASFTDAGGTQLSGGVPWPQKPFGTLRLWDSNTAWAMLEPLKGRWNFQTLDTWVAAAKPGQDIILTLGQSPAWASSNPTKASVYGLGASAPPANIQDWTTYVTSVANRYKGRIRFYEIWNEPNDPDFYSGNIAQLVALTQAANAAIKAVDPGATVISAPAYSAGYLDAYLAAGAKNYVDVIGYHVYANPPEDTGRQLSNVRLAMAKNGVASKPLWDTEGASGDTTTPLTTATNYLLRKYLADLAFGAGRFDWYTWGQATYFCVGTEQANPTVLTGAGVAYGFLQQWLQGATLNKALIDAAGNWQVWITMSGGVKGLIVWNPTVSGTFQIPAGIAMNAVWTFDGRQVSATGASIAVSDAPIMLVGN